MLEPQSTLLFALLIVAFAGLMVWLSMTRRILFRMLAAVIAFAVAMQVGIMAVNKYFDYYQSWGAAFADLTSPGPAVAQISESLLAGHVRNSLSHGSVDLGLAVRQGYTLRVQLPGRLSHITRAGYVYLPPQYFQPTFRQYKFPVIELIHGQPGAPQDWINVVGVITTFDQLIKVGIARPAVLVMPDANGGQRTSLQCINQVRGPQDMTYLGLDVPADISHMLRVQQPGLGWGIAGYSEGGFCAANMALQLRHNYGFAGVLSGYFKPAKNMLAGRPVDPFAGSAARRLDNTPLAEVQALHPGVPLPEFWLSAGRGDRADVAETEYFWQELQNRQANVPLYLPAGQHTMAAWRAEIPPMLEWMTAGLAHEVLHAVPVAVAKSARV
jgi:enterochelin esterase-like enzyme